MIALQISHLEYPTRPERIEKLEIEIGRSPYNDLVLDEDGVSERHAKLALIDGTYYIEDVGSEHGTFLNGVAITTPTMVREIDRIRIGLHIIRIDAHTVERARDEREEQLIAAIERGDSRLGYADFLEERGDSLMAQYLRHQELDEPIPESFVLLARNIDPVWRMRVSRVPIEQCRVQWAFKCPRSWSSLTPTLSKNIRHCEACDRNVFFCSSLSIARDYAETGQCVAIDLGVRRRRGDLGQFVCPSCECVRRPQRPCPRCGEQPGPTDGECDFGDELT